jgi:formate hydrogenlyase subunit 3/multisubunit Na+/H+ antiporter MnhD subunit
MGRRPLLRFWMLRWVMLLEHQLRGQGRNFALLGVVWVACGLALADVPGLGMFLARARIEEAAAAGYGWVAAVFLLVAVLTGGAILRAEMHVFLGWGPPEDDHDLCE